MSKNKRCKYHKYHKFTASDGTEITVVTQLYEIGVYCIINNDPNQQFNFEPTDIVKAENTLGKQESAGEIENLEFGDEITVEEVDGFWKEVCP